MNAAFRGDENLAPRAHPGDARLDVIEGRLPRGDLWRARKRMRAGTHVPHPGLRQRRITEAEFDLGEAMVVAIDGEAVANARHLVVRCLPDAFVMVV